MAAVQGVEELLRGLWLDLGPVFVFLGMIVAWALGAPDLVVITLMLAVIAVSLAGGRARRKRRGYRRPLAPAAANLARVLFFLVVAVDVVLTVLVAIGGFQPDDVLIAVIGWSVAIVLRRLDRTLASARGEGGHA